MESTLSSIDIPPTSVEHSYSKLLALPGISFPESDQAGRLNIRGQPDHGRRLPDRGLQVQL